MSFLHRSWRPKDWAGRVDFRGVSSYVFQFVLCDVFYLDEFSGQRFDVVFDVLVLLLPGQRSPEFPSSNFQMTVNKFLWSKKFPLVPFWNKLLLNVIPRKEFFFFESWRSSVHGWGWRIAVALKSEYLYAAVGLYLQLASSIRYPSTIRSQSE